MYTKMPILAKEYTVSFSEDDETAESPDMNQVSIEGYQVIFDKKVMLTPLEVIAQSQTYNKCDKTGK